MKRPLVFSIVAALSVAEVAARPLGRLFYSPAQRAELVAARQAGAVNDAAATATAAPTAVRLSGIVRGGSGAPHAWIDGQLIADGANLAGYVVRVGETSVRLVGKERELSLHAGESIDLVSGERTPRVTISVHPRR